MSLIKNKNDCRYLFCVFNEIIGNILKQLYNSNKLYLSQCQFSELIKYILKYFFIYKINDSTILSTNTGYKYIDLYIKSFFNFIYKNETKYVWFNSNSNNDNNNNNYMNNGVSYNNLFTVLTDYDNDLKYHLKMKYNMRNDNSNNVFVCKLDKFRQNILYVINKTFLLMQTINKLDELNTIDKYNNVNLNT